MSIFQNGTENSAQSLSPHFVYLSGPGAALPSSEYIRVIAYSASHGNASRGNGSAVNSTQDTEVEKSRGKESKESSGIGANGNASAERHDFALHMRGARLCRLLDVVLDTADLCPSDAEGNRTAQYTVPPVVLPHATRRGCETVFCYLELLTRRMPTAIGKPLRAPLEELLQPWELRFLLKQCLDVANDTEGANRAKGTNGKNGNSADDALPGIADCYKRILARAPNSLSLLLEVAMISDFLRIDSLCQLTCAFVASLAVGAGSGAELLQLCGQSRAMTEAELEPLYEEMPFLRMNGHPGT